MKLNDQIAQIPFLRLIVPLILGVVVADMVDVSAVALLWGVALLVVGVLFMREERVLIAALIFILGMAAVKVNYPGDKIPRNVRVALSCTINDNPISKGRWQQTTASANAYKIYDDSAATWQSCNEGLQLNVDTTIRVVSGDRIGCVGYVNPLDTTNGTSSYAQTMRSRGINGKAYLLSGRVEVIENKPPKGIIAVSKAVQQNLVKRLSAINYDSKESSVAIALLTGDRRLLDKDTKEEYARSGVSHILAISGLHLGIIFLIINYLFTPLIFVRNGRILRSLLVIALLWGYAFVTGLSASVLRAAFMLTVLQMSEMTVWRYNAYNALFGSAFVLVLINPYYIYDISFQMSYLGLISILFFYKRISRWTGVSRAINTMKFKEIDLVGPQYFFRLAARGFFTFITGTLILGISAQIGVMPLMGYLFGRLPLANLLINPIIMAIIALIMVVGFFYIITQWSFSGEIFAYLMKIQNGVVEWTSHLKYASIEGVNFSQKVLYLTYFMMLITVFVIKRFEKERR